MGLGRRGRERGRASCGLEETQSGGDTAGDQGVSSPGLFAHQNGNNGTSFWRTARSCYLGETEAVRLASGIPKWRSFFDGFFQQRDWRGTQRRGHGWPRRLREVCRDPVGPGNGPYGAEAGRPPAHTLGFLWGVFVWGHSCLISSCFTIRK